MLSVQYQPTERRPIAARRWAICQRTARWLAARGVSPNGISLAGMVCGLAASATLAATAGATGWERLAWVAAGVFIQLRLLANLLDGMVAVESGRASRVGELYNEIPDRISDAATIVGAGYAAGGDIVAGFLAAIVAMFTAYVRTAGKAAGAPHEYCGPLAKQQRMALLTLIALWCGLTPAAWQPAFDSSGHGLVTVGLWIIIVGGLVTAARRLARIAAHLQVPPS
jgi:phosphatidylglycerophosphate synthase